MSKNKKLLVKQAQDAVRQNLCWLKREMEQVTGYESGLYYFECPSGEAVVFAGGKAAGSWLVDLIRSHGINVIEDTEDTEVYHEQE